MFITNKYSDCYWRIILRARNRICDPVGYWEQHHIVPKALGGEDHPDNLILLTYKEHYICHHLLCYMTAGKHKRKMQHAFAIMSAQGAGQQRHLTVGMREACRRANAAAQRGQKASPETRLRKSEAAKAHWSNNEDRKQQARERMRARNLGVPKSPEVRAKLSAIGRARVLSPERNAKISASQKRYWKLTTADGQVHLTGDLPNWCAVNGYSGSGISNLKAGRVKSHKDIVAAEILDQHIRP